MRRAWGLMLLLAACAPAPAVVVSDRVAMAAFAPLPALPPDAGNPVADDLRAAALGQQLFYDVGYSANGKVSCASCHQPGKAFSDGQRVATAIAAGTRNTPSLLYAAYEPWQGWGGRADSVWDQAIVAMQNPKEMGATPAGIAKHTLEAGGATYRDLFGAETDTASVTRHTGQLLEAYVRKLVPGPSAFDRYAAGDDTAMDADARAGFGVFAGKARCALCHKGPTFSDGDFHNLGLPQPFATFDLGRAGDLAALSKDPFKPASVPAVTVDDEGRFRTPTLRNVSQTAPYWHGGSFASLDAVLDLDLNGGGSSTGHLYPGTQDALLQPVSLTADERRQLLAFLKSLDAGPVPAPWNGPPSLP